MTGRFLLALHLLCVFGASRDPRHERAGSALNALVLWIVPALAIAVSSATYLTALGYPVDIAGIVLILLGSMFVVLGNYFPKCRQNSTIGIKVPWTLGDEETWQRTHRFAGPVWVAAGLILCANAVVSLRSPVALLIVIGFAVVVPIAYPAWFYHYVREL